MTVAYYNEPDPYAAHWLKNLMNAGHIAPGYVDERDVRDVRPADLAVFTQCHFFAGIGIWSHALRSVGWSDSQPIWTGSCPCQPFSAAGKRAGVDDERHLWPHWFWLIEQCQPPIVVGEQVASKDGLEWFDLVSSDLESANYAVGAADLCAAGSGGAHLRQRLYFVGLENAKLPEGARFGKHSRQNLQQQKTMRPAGTGRHGGNDLCDARQTGSLDDADWLLCRNLTGEPVWRPVGPGAFPLVNEAPTRVGRLRAYGNALDAETAIQWCETVKGVLI